MPTRTVKGRPNKADQQIASRMKRYLEIVDQIAFPDQQAEIVVFDEKNPNTPPIGYASFLRKQGRTWIPSEGYIIRTPGLSRFLRKMRAHEKQMFIRGKPVTMKQMLIAIACHEVRHRIQRLARIKTFCHRSKAKNDRILQEHIDLIAKDFYPRHWKEIHNGGKIKITIRAPRTEFDARVIHRMALSRVRSIRDTKTIRKVLFLQAT